MAGKRILGGKEVNQPRDRHACTSLNLGGAVLTIVIFWAIPDGIISIKHLPHSMLCQGGELNSRPRAYETRQTKFPHLPANGLTWFYSGVLSRQAISSTPQKATKRPNFASRG